MSTPLEVSIALWYHIRPGDFGKGNGDNNFDAPAVREALVRFVDAGLLKRNEPNADLPQEYVGTDGLRIFVEALCQMPWPVQQWTWPNHGRQNTGLGVLGSGAAGNPLSEMGRQFGRSAA